jgi:hypothetical protein
MIFEDFIRIIECLFQSLCDLDKMKIVHRDIKMENFVVKIYELGFTV